MTVDHGLAVQISRICLVADFSQIDCSAVQIGGDACRALSPGLITEGEAKHPPQDPERVIYG